jgi:uncharacterized protein
MNTVVAADRVPQARTERNGLRHPPLPGLALGAVMVYALDAWVIRVEGETTWDRRLLYLMLIGACACLAYGARKLGPRSRSIGMVTSGLVVLTIASPIVISHLDKQGLKGARVTGLLALAGGLGLLSIGTTRLIRTAQSRWRKLLAIPIALVLAQFFLLPVGLAVYTTNAARPELSGRTPADVGLDFEDVVVTSADDTLLAGWYVPATNGAAVVLRHGSGSTRVSLIDHAAFLAEAGYGVLMLDARGHGESDGRINEMGWHGTQDIGAALDYLSTRQDVAEERYGILGLSMGGEEALHAAAGDERIGAVVSEGAGIGTYGDSIAAGSHAVERIVNWTQFAAVDLLSDASQPESINRTIGLIAPRPVLLIAGDEAVEREVDPLYAVAGGGSTELWMLSDTPHTDGLRVHEKGYERRVLELFGGALLGE